VNKPTFYEQVGIVIPGAVFLVGLLFYFPALYALMAKDGVTLGQFGIFLLLSYAAGHLLAAVGNGLEKLWELAGGMPSDWITKPGGTGLLAPVQVDAVAAKARSRLGCKIEKIPGMERRAWFPIGRQIYADVAKNGKSDRIDVFNGNYGLNRGLTASMLGLAVISLLEGKCTVAVGLAALALVYGYRTYRFGCHYGRELYMQFLILPDPPTAAPASAEE
jgi:hypothetical protein